MRKHVRAAAVEDILFKGCSKRVLKCKFNYMKKETTMLLLLQLRSNFEVCLNFCYYLLADFRCVG